MATSLGKLMTKELGTMEPLKLINAIHQIFPTSHLLSIQQDCTPLPALCRSPRPHLNFFFNRLTCSVALRGGRESHGRDYVSFLVNEL